ncbi:MAG: sensor histidine kinase [Aquificaceae bacterium]
MSVRLKALILFFSLYVSSVFLLSFLSLLVIRSSLYEYTLNYMEYQVNPLIDFYKKYYKNPDFYAKLLAEDIVSREITSILVNNEGKVINKESFLEGDMPEVEEEEIRQMLKGKKGVGRKYAFIVKEVGHYELIILGKLEGIRKIEKRILLFTGVLVLLISLPASLLAVFLIKRLLEPLSYLREISELIYKGQLDIEIRVSGRKDEFGLLEEAYANMVDRLKSIILWQREFIRNITHALKTPLAYIKGQMELLQMGAYKEEKLREIYSRVQAQSEKMERLITQLATIMRLESQMPLKMERVSINQLFAEMEEEYEFIKEERRFYVKYLEEDKEIEVDKEYFKLALRNLIENAYKYSEKGARISLYFKDGCIVVEDEGIGMEHTERAGELFYREATDKEGTGLGLYIVKLIAQKSGMSMNVESKKGLGTKVSLCYNFKL